MHLAALDLGTWLEESSTRLRWALKRNSCEGVPGCGGSHLGALAS